MKIEGVIIVKPCCQVRIITKSKSYSKYKCENKYDIQL